MEGFSPAWIALFSEGDTRGSKHKIVCYRFKIIKVTNNERHEKTVQKKF